MVRLEIMMIIILNYLFIYLHSSMVRLEIDDIEEPFLICSKFTFQYGQIRNSNPPVRLSLKICIYIPVWLDQKSSFSLSYEVGRRIYIPVWLDQKCWSVLSRRYASKYLHSSMVRLEIITVFVFILNVSHLHSSMVRLEIHF